MHKVNKLSENESQLAQRLAQEKRKILCPVLLLVLVFCLCRGLFTVKYELMLLYLCLGLCLCGPIAVKFKSLFFYLSIFLIYLCTLCSCCCLLSSLISPCNNNAWSSTCDKCFFCSVNHALLINYTAKRNINVIIVINISILHTVN